MKFKLYQPGKVKEEGDVLLNVYDNGNGDVAITVVDEEGNHEWNLATFMDGILFVHPYVGVEETTGMQFGEYDSILTLIK